MIGLNVIWAIELTRFLLVVSCLPQLRPPLVFRKVQFSTKFMVYSTNSLGKRFSDIALNIGAETIDRVKKF